MSSIKIPINGSAIFDDFFRDSNLLGIITSERPHRFCWKVNKELNFKFRLNQELEATIQKKDKKCFFQVYECLEPLRFTSHYIYENRYKGEYLLPELKHIDYLWLLKGVYYTNTMIEELISDVKGFNSVQMVSLLRVRDLKNSSNLII